MISKIKNILPYSSSLFQYKNRVLSLKLSSKSMKRRSLIESSQSDEKNSKSEFEDTISRDSSFKKNIKIFEEDPKELAIGIQIINLTKVFGRLWKLKPAIDNLSLNIYENQITVLLGPNGAGKSTLLSILSGMMSPTKGTAIVNGYDIRTHLKEARRSISLCPQENMLFDLLSVEEHLHFYGLLKGISSKQLQDDIYKLLKILHLIKQRDLLSKNITNATKRKLHTAIAILGRSQIIMLDQPTLGLGPRICRQIWSLLNNMRPGRTILLTTHLMKEADILGDRIIIMGKGKITCCGTAMFLKQQLGGDYHLHINKAEYCDVKGVARLIKTYVPSAYVEKETAGYIKYALPSEYFDEFRLLFRKIEGNFSNLGVSNVGVSYINWDQIFTRLENASERIDTDINESRYQASADDEENDAEINQRTGSFLSIHKFFGLLLKRWTIVVHYKLFVTLQFLIPGITTILISILIMFLRETIPQEEKPSLKLDISLFQKTVVYYYITDDDLENSYKKLLPAGTEAFERKDIDKDIVTLQKDNWHYYRTNCIIGAELHRNGSNIRAIALHNSFFLHSLPISLTHIHNTLLFHFTKNEKWKIIPSNQPLPKNPKVKTSHTTVFSFKLWIFTIPTPFALSSVIASFVLIPMKERISRNKYLQNMTGVGSLLFWGSHFIFDFIHYFLLIAMVFIIHALLDTDKLFRSSPATELLFALFLLYGTSAIPVAYMISFIFKLEDTGYVAAVILHILTGIFLWPLSTIMRENNLWTPLMQWIASLFPAFNLTDGFSLVVMTVLTRDSLCNFDKNTLKILCAGAKKADDIYTCCPQCETDCVSKAHLISWQYLKPLVMLAVESIFYFLLLVFFDSSWYVSLKYFINRLFIQTPTSSGIEVYDRDVIDERNRIKELIRKKNFKTDTLIVNDMTKAHKRILAVDHIYFGIKNYECFGMLGVHAAGKSVLFQMLIGNELISGGNAYLHGKNIIQNRKSYLKQMGCCLQSNAVLDFLTGRETLFLFAQLRGIRHKDIISTVERLIDFVELQSEANKLVEYYSDGNKRKLSIAVALIGGPKIILLDEPTIGLDPFSRRVIWDVLVTAKQSGTPILLTSNSMEECEALCDRIGIMEISQLQCLGEIPHLQERFGRGYNFVAFLDKRLGDKLESDQASFKQLIEENFKSPILKEEYRGMINYHIDEEDIKWSHVFDILEIAKEKYRLEDFTIRPTTLEEVFVAFS